MHRMPGSLFSLAPIALGALLGCAGVGPPVVEHPRSGAMTAVSPESEPLAGAVRLPPDPPAPRRIATRAPSTLSLPGGRELTAMSRSRVVIDVSAFDLALGDDTAAEAPDVALSEVLAFSSGPAPRLDDASSALLQVSAPAVEEGAWEARRRSP